MTGIAPIKNFAGFSLNNSANNQNLIQSKEQSQLQEQAEKTNIYSDPLHKWPLRGMAFTNDIGAAIMDIAPKAGVILWIPALMYFGADIYDKYKNDETSYDPSARRGLKQATFQALASILFPIVTVHGGQKIFSVASRLGKNKLSLQTQEEIIEHQKNYMMHVKMQDVDVNTYKKEYGEALNNYLDEVTRQRKNQGLLKRFNNFVFGTKHHEVFKNREPIEKFVNDRIDNLFSMYEQLMRGEQPEKMSAKMFTKFSQMKNHYKNSKEHSVDFASKAAKDVLKMFEDNKIFKVKLLKSLGGFVALGALITPIDKFVEHVIIEKFVDPSLKRFDNGQIKEFKQKIINS